MRPILFWLGDTPVFAFPVVVTLAFLAGGLVLQRDLARKQIPGELAWWIVGTAVAGGMIGARAHFGLTHWNELLADPWAFATGRSGLVWYGGVAGGALATLWPVRVSGAPWLRVADSAALALALGLAVGRVGCHLAGDGDWGVPTTLPWGVAYPEAIAGWPHPEGVVVHPAPLYEMAALLALVAVLWRLRTRVSPDGAVVFLYLAAAAAIRFLIEFIRTNPKLALGLTEAQWTSLALFAGASLWLRARLEGSAQGDAR
jgi:phosphatidylglycerol:prolipoprotein diacylglycerol transferase